MNSMNYIREIMSNFREFYNEINAATLTGAIDVVVVEQADGTFTCSPFHVRFGKLGVLRSREKVVDIEINGEPQDIHMKLGDSGEAFFVEEVLSPDSEPIPEHLATSPIPVSEFEKLYVPESKPRRKSIDLGYDNIEQPPLENQVNDYTKRRYTDSHGQDFSLKKREFVTRQIGLGNIDLGEHSNEDLSLSRADSISVNNKQSDEDFNQDSEISEPIFKMDSLDAEHTPKETTPVAEEKIIPKLDIPKLEEEKVIEPEVKTSGKKRRRKKSMIKKKNQQRKTSIIFEPKETDLSDGQTQDYSNSENNNKMCESITDKSSIESSQSEHELISGSDSTLNNRMIGRDPDFLFFSDTELTNKSERSSRPNTPVQSDTEFEMSQRKDNDQPPGQSWAWGQLPNAPNKNDMSSSLHEDSLPESEAKQAERNSMLSSMFSFMKQNKRMRHNGSPEGMYLADLSSGTLDPEVAALYFPNTRTERHPDADNDCESGNGPSLPQSPNSIEGAKSIDSDYDDHKNDCVNRILQDISLSLCGWSEQPNEDHFIRHIVSFTDLCNNPSLLESPDLVVRIGEKYYSYRAAAPIIISMLVYQRQLPQSTVDQLCTMHMSTINLQDKIKKPESRGYSWWSWRRSKGDRSASTEIQEAIPDKMEEIPVTPAEEIVIKEVIVKDETVIENIVKLDTTEIAIETAETSLEPDVGESQGQDEGDVDPKRDLSLEMTQSMYGEKFRKTLRLSSEQIKNLNLNEGMNEVEFSVTTAYQGTTRCKCHIYRWRYDDKIVISDIDGTITKSDVLGHILPIVGKDWAQSGVAQLFTKIMNNGYKLLYLSARAIGQARVTREYLRSIKQGNLSLPDGPLLLNPTSLISAFHREVIEKKPEQFKISCLSDIQALFPPDSNPFYAGYGNRINDVWAYRAVGIPIVRIFTINHRGELKHELTQTFQSSYSNMSSYVDQLFPPLIEAANEYSQFVYWREPISSIDEEIEMPVLSVK